MIHQIFLYHHYLDNFSLGPMWVCAGLQWQYSINFFNLHIFFRLKKIYRYLYIPGSYFTWIPKIYLTRPRSVISNFFIMANLKFWIICLLVPLHIYSNGVVAFQDVFRKDNLCIFLWCALHICSLQFEKLILSPLSFILIVFFLLTFKWPYLKIHPYFQTLSTVF